MTREEQAQYIAEKLMENPEFRKAFASAVTNAVNEVVKATKVLQQELCNELDFVQPHKKISVNLEPCDDTISRDKAIVQLSHNKIGDDDCDVIIQKDIETIKALPPAEKVNDWIPVSERYPEDGQRVLVDYCDEDAGIMLIRFNVNGYRGFKAWMPLPEPYKASPTGEEVDE